MMNMGCFVALLLFGSLVLFPASGFAGAADVISASQTLRDGETLNSSGGFFQLGFFSPGRSTGRYLGIWYRNIAVQTVVWVANRSKPVFGSSGSLLVNSTGDLVLMGRGKFVVWSGSPTGLVRSPVLQLLDNGNLVLRAADASGSSSSGNFFWQSFDYPTDTFLPEMKLGWDFRTGINRSFSSWRSPDDPSPGDFTWGLEHINYPEALAWKGGSKYFRSGPWNGIRFSGAPQQSFNPIFWFSFVSNKDEVYYMYHVDNKSMLVRSTLNQSNYMWERSTWSPESQSWRVFLQLPKDYCDSYGLCGAYGMCTTNNLPYCQCMKGFSPSSPDKWNSNDWSQGCVRNKPLSCRNSKDGFMKYSNVKLPDTTNCSVDATLSLKDCEKKCLSNCSCTAYTNSNISGRGSGCAMWFGDLLDMRQYPNAGQDIYIRMLASEIGKNGPKAWMIAVVVLPVSVSCLMLVICWFCRSRRKKKLTGKKEVSFVGREHEIPEDDFELPLFDLASISKATNSFSAKNKLGEGGFGPVFKGVLDDGHEIAVKKLSASSTQGMHEFKNEVILIAKLQHRNLVKLLGCCIQGEELMLIYEYMRNKSLDAFIFDPSRSKLLDWKLRFSIICGVARGLLYLHQDSRLRIIHRDLKASNVLLDDEMNPKISDFGLARIFGGDQTEANTTRVVGTYGYMAPEYAIDGLFSVKSDVFSFGILILETVSGKRNRGFYHSNNSLVGHAWELYKTGKSVDMIDPSLTDTCTISEVLRCIHVGLLCLQELPDDRPTMSSVVVMLSSDGPLPYPRQPGFLAERKMTESMSSSSKHDSTSVNDISFTLLQPR